MTPEEAKLFKDSLEAMKRNASPQNERLQAAQAVYREAMEAFHLRSVNLTLSAALMARRTTCELEAENERLRSTARRYFVVPDEYCKDVMYCRECNRKWPKEMPESHADGCIGKVL